MSAIGMLSRRFFAARRAPAAARAASLKCTIKALEKTIKRVGRLMPDMPDVPCLPLCDEADEPQAIACAAHVAAIVVLTAALIALRKKDEEA